VQAGPHDRAALALKLAAPYLAVLVFWVGFHTGWLAILAYHAQILWWSRGRLPGLARPRRSALMWFAAPSLLAGPALYVILPRLAGVDLGAWLASYGLTGGALVAMIAYYGLVHPVLEQVHWAPLRNRTPLAHIAFAGYHMIVLYSLLPLPWLAACFAVLVVASWTWQRMAGECGSLWPGVASHAAADLGMVIVAWLLA